MKPMIIGKFKHPRCFPVFSVSSKFYYSFSVNSWVAIPIFNKYLSSLNNQFRTKNKFVCLLLDNCKAHIVCNSSFANINLVYITPKTTSIAQPLDGGFLNYLFFNLLDIIELCKRLYRTSLRFVFEIEIHL
jgi:hypothetical protein